MKHRFLKLPMCIVEEGAIYTSDLMLQPFTIEAYLTSSIAYTDEQGMSYEEECVRVYTKSGMEFDLLMTMEEFEEATKHF